MEPTIQLRTGKYFHFLNPDPDCFTIQDIAYGLSQTCRFGGHCRGLYTVAQHSVLASYIVPEQYALEALLHDAAEAFVGDVTSPLKALLPEFKAIEGIAYRCIANKYGIPEVESPEVKTADLIMLATERRDLMPTGGDEHWSCILGHEPLPDHIRVWSQGEAYCNFLDRFRVLCA